MRDLVKVKHPLRCFVGPLDFYNIIMEHMKDADCGAFVRRILILVFVVYLHKCSWEHFIAVWNCLDDINRNTEEGDHKSSLVQIFVSCRKLPDAILLDLCQAQASVSGAPNHDENWDDVVKEEEKRSCAKTEQSALFPKRKKTHVSFLI